MKKCPKCGTEYNYYMKKCVDCGVALEDLEGPEAPSKEIEKKQTDAHEERTMEMSSDIRAIKNILIYFAALTTIGLVGAIIALLVQ